MRLNRTTVGRMNLDITDVGDYDIARKAARAIMKAFNGRQRCSLVDVDGTSWLDIDLECGAAVTVGAHLHLGVNVYAMDEASDGAICDIANYLMAHPAELGINTDES